MWRDVPRRIRVPVFVLVAVMLYGGVVHVVQLATGGWPPYGWAPGWLAAYFTALTVLDPLAAGLVLARRASGLYLAAFVLVTDAAANAHATYVVTDGGIVPRIAQGVISVLAVGSVIVAWRAPTWVAGKASRRAGTASPGRGPRECDRTTRSRSGS
ncbi:hypothetical protein [Cryptosporangium arvum]|uniref:Uncharacterized protein n=1 Tax=Cryptosporangium arvum DSM 44712 TaxID=927661 RepID=A0A010ZPD0_9ACTN|nr:hypothetical protein [Cryptosporangium arvum]EXG80539.1 hypothetical protein CryarDRAFT_1619 [Cryptosporangium arvum DSM 44712]